MQRMTEFKSRCSRSVFALVSLVLLSASPIDQALAQHKIVEGFVSHGALQWPEYIATEFGWFKENGVELDMLVVGAGAAQQVAAGALNIAYSGFPDFIRATNAGAPVKIVINAIGQPPYSVYSKPAIKKISDLKGKIASIGGQRDITLIYMEAFLAGGGLKAKDMDFVYAKATQDRLAALASGGVDAAILYPPSTFRAGAQGFTYLGDIEPYLKDFPFTVWAANTDWAAKNRPAMLAYIKAYGRCALALRRYQQREGRRHSREIFPAGSQGFRRHLRLLGDQAEGVQRRWVDQRGHLQKDDRRADQSRGHEAAGAAYVQVLRSELCSRSLEIEAESLRGNRPDRQIIAGRPSASIRPLKAT